ncbi:MAG: hypothetical protein ACI89G_002463 [Minisyncoccia bacterium]|jgi:hypothetical protein
MLGQVLAYGSERPDVFSGYRLEWMRPNDGAFVTAMTSDHERHVKAFEQISSSPMNSLSAPAHDLIGYRPPVPGWATPGAS